MTYLLELRYKDHYVGENHADLIVRNGDGAFVLELKVLPGGVCAGKKQQLRKYMQTLNISNGLLVNFHKPPVSREKIKEDESQFDRTT